MYYFIVNTWARTGNAAHLWNEVKEFLHNEHIAFEAYETTHKGHATELARQLTEHADAKIDIIILGGDGTINEVVNGIADFDKVRVGVIPTGTGNDFARNLGIKGTVSEILQDILSKEKGIKLDVGAVRWDDMETWRLFNISSGIGFDALVCKKTATSRVKRICNRLHLGKLSYLIVTVQSLFSMKTFNSTASFGKHPGASYHRAIFSAAMNLRAEGGGVPMAPSSDPCDGMLPFCIAADIPTLVLPFYLMLLVMGKHEKLDCFHTIHDTECHIHTDLPVVLHADGEYLADVTNVWYRCLPQKLELLNTMHLR